MNYTKLSELARKKCRQYGAMCFIVKTESVYNKETHEAMDMESKDGGYGIISSYDESLINGTTILQGDLKVIFTPHSVAKPSSSDILEIGSNRYNILAVNPLSPNGETVIMYELQVRA